MMGQEVAPVPKATSLFEKSKTRRENEGEFLLLTVTTQNGALKNAKDSTFVPFMAYYDILQQGKATLQTGFRFGHGRSHPLGILSTEQCPVDPGYLL